MMNSRMIAAALRGQTTPPDNPCLFGGLRLPVDGRAREAHQDGAKAVELDRVHMPKGGIDQPARLVADTSQRRARGNQLDDPTHFLVPERPRQQAPHLSPD